MRVSWSLKDLNVISFEKRAKPLYSGHFLKAHTFLGPDGVRYREISLYLHPLVYSFIPHGLRKTMPSGLLHQKLPQVLYYASLNTCGQNLGKKFGSREKFWRKRELKL